MPATDSGVFALTPGPVTAAHIRELVKAGSGHAIAINPEGTTVVIEWTATTALEDAGRHQPVWTHHEYMCMFGWQDNHKLTPTWQKRLAGVANRQYEGLVDRSDVENEAWLRHPKPRDAMERLAHAVTFLREAVTAHPEKEAKFRGEIAVPSPLESRWGRPDYGLTFGDLDDLYRMVTAGAKGSAGNAS